jgi:hypothetical protein
MVKKKLLGARVATAATATFLVVQYPVVIGQRYTVLPQKRCIFRIGTMALTIIGAPSRLIG